MHTTNSAGHIFSASAALVMLAACSGGPQMAPAPQGQALVSQGRAIDRAVQYARAGNGIVSPDEGSTPRGPVTPSFFRPAANGKPLIFIADERHNVVNIYLQNGQNQLVGQITGLYEPLGVATDRAANVYIPLNQSVPVYAPPYTSGPSMILDDTGQFPYRVAISRLGVVAAVNICSAPSCALETASVTFYAPGTTQPCTTVLAPSNVALLDTPTFDHDGNLFVAGRSSASSGGGNIIGEVKGGCAATTFGLLTLTKPWYGSGIKMNKTNQLTLINLAKNFKNVVLETYAHPKNGVLGNPVASIWLRHAKFPEDFAFLASGSRFYIADFLVARATEYVYPQGGPPINEIPVFHGGHKGIHRGLPSDIAVTPPLIPR